jgi:S1-C subfamily serine protease/mono/diheme cytochrome c family protein
MAGTFSGRAARGRVDLPPQYVGVDYGVAVRDGKIASEAEYREVFSLAEAALERYAALRPRGTAARDLTRLRDLIRTRAGWEAVRASSQDLVKRLADELDVVPYPSARPDLEAGRELYRVSCAACHGGVGGGDGPSAPWMSPKPTSFRAPVMSLISPHQVFNAEVFGMPGTAMPSYRQALPPQDLWNIAFFVMTMRDGFDPAPPVEIVPLSLPEISALSDEELLKRLRVSRPGALASEVDFYRGQFLPPAPPEGEGDAALSMDDGLAVALQLERAFGEAADKVFPSVVGISIYEREPAEAPKAGASEGWQEGAAEEQLYPGFRRVASASGVVVSGDGEILTSAGIFSGPAGSPSDRVIDVELPGNVHGRAWVVGIEPTVDLAVLEVAAPVPVRPAVIGDSDAVKVGQWAIAVGDPPGAERTFAPGTISARPERECYQEHRTSTLIQTSATIDPRALGGPLVNIRGSVVGITVAGKPTVNGLPINLAMTLYRALKIAGSERSPWLGISVLELNAALRARLGNAPLTGIYIDDVFSPSPASSAGIRVGDVLTKMDGHPILSVADFQTWLYILGIGTPVDLEIARGTKAKTMRIPATIQQRPGAAVPR